MKKNVKNVKIYIQWVSIDKKKKELQTTMKVILCFRFVRSVFTCLERVVLHFVLNLYGMTNHFYWLTKIIILNRARFTAKHI